MMGCGSSYRLFLAWALLMRAARDLLMPFLLSASYVLGFLTEGPCFLPGIHLERAAPAVWTLCQSLLRGWVAAAVRALN